MKQYTSILNLKLLAVDSSGNIKKEVFITQNDIGEFALENNVFLGTSVLQTTFIDTPAFFSGADMANSILYVRAESMGNELSPMQTQWYKIVSWDSYSNGTVSINLALPSMYIRLASDTTLKIYSKETPIELIISDIAKNNNGEYFLSTKYPVKSLIYPLTKYDNALNFIRYQLLSYMESTVLGNNDFHFVVGSNKLMVIPALYNEKPLYRIKIGQKIKGYKDIDAKEIYSTEWSKTYSAHFCNNINFNHYCKFDTQSQELTEVDFKTKSLSLVDNKSFNYMDIKYPINRLIDYQSFIPTYDIINNFNKNFGFKVYIPVNTLYLPNNVITIDTSLSKNINYNAWFEGKAWVYSVIHYFTNDGKSQDMISIIKCLKNAHNGLNTMFTDAKLNTQAYED